MLGKLLKYEIRATSRTFLPLYGGLMVLSLLMRFFILGNLEYHVEGTAGFVATLIFGLVGLLYGLVITAVFILTAVVMIQRFYKNLLGDEGYLMFTLPVKPWKHIASKSITSAIWICASVVAVTISGCLMVMTLRDLSRFFDFGQFIRPNGTEIVLALQICLFMLLCLFCGILVVYASISVGQIWHRHKMAGAFLAYLGLSVIEVTVISIVSKIMSQFEINIDMTTYVGQANALMLIMNIVAGAVAVGCFLLTNFMLSRKVNLD